ncbi:hypothetical protein AAG906_041092 [Vitis piasezkii]
MESSGVRKGARSHEEDVLLRNCIEKYGEGKWHLVPLRAAADAFDTQVSKPSSRSPQPNDDIAWWESLLSGHAQMDQETDFRFVALEGSVSQASGPNKLQQRQREPWMVWWNKSREKVALLLDMDGYTNKALLRDDQDVPRKLGDSVTPVIPDLNEDEVQEVFNLFDTDNDGRFAAQGITGPGIRMQEEIVC